MINNMIHEKWMGVIFELIFLFNENSKEMVYNKKAMNVMGKL